MSLRLTELQLHLGEGMCLLFQGVNRLLLRDGSLRLDPNMKVFSRMFSSFFFSFENVLLMVFVSVFVICYLLLTPRRSIWIVYGHICRIETNDHRSGWAISDIEIDLRGSHVRLNVFFFSILLHSHCILNFQHFQINVKPLNSTQTSTPRFTPEELFEFIRIEKGDD